MNVGFFKYVALLFFAVPVFSVTAYGAETFLPGQAVPENYRSNGHIIIDGSGEDSSGPGEDSSGPGGSSGGANQNPDNIPGTNTDPDIPQIAENPNKVFSRGRELDLTKPMIALTYDDGPQTTAGNAIMDVFAAYGQRCTFFMVGSRVPSRAEEVVRMVNDGHEVANHSQDHLYLDKYGAETTVSQVAACNTAIANACGVTPVLMRLPGGRKNSAVLGSVNMPVILWNIDTRDWETRDADSITAHVIGKVKDGDIVLMHELYDTTASATGRIVPELVNEGFQLVTVSELASFKGYRLEPGKVYYSFP